MDHAVKYPSQAYIWKSESDFLVIILVTVVMTLFAKLLWNRRKLYYYTWNLKGPLSFPLIGTLHRFAVGSTTSDIMNTIMDIQKESPDLATFWYGPRLIYLVSKPEIIEKVLNHPDCFNKDTLYRFISSALGDGLMTSPGIDYKWKKNRKLIAPSFNSKILDSFVEIFDSHANILVDQLQKHVGEPNFDIFQSMTNCTLDIICETAMGVQMHAQTAECGFAESTDKMLAYIALRIFHVLYQPEWLWNLLPASQEYYDCLNVFNSFCDNVVKKKLAAHQQKMRDQENGLNADIEESGSKKIKAFLDLLLEYGIFNEQELMEEVNIFVVAGTDTTAMALTAISVCLATNPVIQEKVYQEVISILGNDRSVTPSDIPLMKYTDMVIKESLRLFPVAPFFLRTIGVDLDVGEAILPKGSSAFFGALHLHRHPGYWKDPLKFDPDRFLPENVAKRHPCTYIPFSHGSRNCIGMRYAMTNIKTILATVLRRFRFTSRYKCVGDVELSTNVTLRFTNGTQLTVHER